MARHGCSTTRLASWRAPLSRFRSRAVLPPGRKWGGLSAKGARAGIISTSQLTKPIYPLQCTPCTQDTGHWGRGTVFVQIHTVPRLQSLCLTFASTLWEKDMRLTYFKSLYDSEAQPYEVAWPEFVASLTHPATLPDKASCPLIKLASFGQIRSPKGLLRCNENVTAISGIELDYDGEKVPMPEGAERLKRAGVEAFLYTSASHKPEAPRWRVLIPLATEYPPEYREALCEAADAMLGGICAPESGTLSQAYYVGHVATSPYEAVHVQGQPLDTLTKPEPRPLKRTTIADVPDFVHIDLDRLPIDAMTRSLITTPPSDTTDRSSLLMMAANALARAQVPAADIIRILADPQYPISAKALEKRSQAEAMEWLARYTVAKALTAFPPLADIFPPLAGRPIDRTKLLHDFNELANNPRPIKWLIKGILEQECFAVQHGPPGAGKSILGVDFGCCVAAGIEFHGRKVSQGPVIYVSGEGFGGFPRRLRAWKVANPDARIPEGYFEITSRSVRFRDESSLREFATELEALVQKLGRPPVLIIIDTYARANAGGDENKSSDASWFVSQCDMIKERYKCSVLLMAHTGRGDQTRLMGSQVITGAADVEMGLTRAENNPDVKNVSILKCTKMKDAEPFADLYFQLETQKLGPEWIDPDSFEQSVSWTFEEIDAPRALKRTELEVTFARCVGSTPIDRDKVRASFYQLHPSGNENTRKKAWQRVLARAIERQWVREEGDMLIPSPPAMYRDGIDLNDQVAG